MSTSDKLCRALIERGMGRFVALTLIRQRKRVAVDAMHKGASIDEAVDVLQRFERRARENVQRYRRQRKAKFAQFAAIVKADCGFSN